MQHYGLLQQMVHTATYLSPLKVNMGGPVGRVGVCIGGNRGAGQETTLTEQNDLLHTILTNLALKEVRNGSSAYISLAKNNCPLWKFQHNST
jgi:hypothetical protein